jgi:hypothetical protein
MRRSLALCALLTAIVAAPVLGSTVAPPSNLGELARISKAVVFAEAVGARTEARGEIPHTIVEFRTLRQLKGTLGSTFELEQAGGFVGELGFVVTGAPKFETGGRYLLFLEEAGAGRWKPRMLSYGLLVERGDRLVPLPEAASLGVIQRPGVEPVGEYRPDALLSHLATVSQGGSPWVAEAVAADSASAFAKEEGDSIRFVGEELHQKPAVCSLLKAADGKPIRWFGFEAGTSSVQVWHTTPGQAGISDGGVAAVQNGAAAWRNHPNSAINLTYGGSRAASVNCADGDAREGTNDVIFNDPCNQISDLTVCSGPLPPGWSSTCCGEVAHFGTFVNNSEVKTHDGEAWRPILGHSTVVNDGAQCLGETDFQEMMTHFAGHALGFDHHDDSNATMYGQLGVHAPRGAALSSTDLQCAQYVYHTFSDVPYTRWSWKYVEAIENAGITKGCGGGQYCLSLSASRAEMAVFLIRGIHGADFIPPPATGTIFADVPASYWAAPFIEQLFADGLTKGCAESPRRYCSDGQVTRAEMAVFLVRIEHGNSYVPPPAQGVFEDVATSYWAADNIEQIYNDGITTGCSSSPLQYCPTLNVHREEMAAFLARVFDLPIPQ